MIASQRINHPALIARDTEATIQFYTEIMKMPLVLRQPNLDDPSLEHLFFDSGNNTFIAFFGPATGYPPIEDQVKGGTVGFMKHLAFDVSPEVFKEALEYLPAHGIKYRGPIDRGYERSIYFPDPNGITLEFLTWITPPPPDIPQSTIIKRAQDIRVAEGAHHIEDEHIRRVIAELMAERAG